MVTSFRADRFAYRFEKVASLVASQHPGVLLARHVGPKNIYVRGYIAGKASLNTVKVRADQPFKPQYQHTNSPVWSPYWRYISLRNWLREFDKRSKHFPFGNYYINSHNPSSLWCADIIRRKLMLITLGTDSLLSEIWERDLFHRDFTLGDHTTCYDVGKSH